MTNEDNKYMKLKRLIEDNGFVIKTSRCYDPQSGWAGTDLWVLDGEKIVCNLSINGYHFNDYSIDKSVESIETYIQERDFNTFEAFEKWVYSVEIKEG